MYVCMYARMQVCIKFSAEYRFHGTVQRLKSLVVSPSKLSSFYIIYSVLLLTLYLV